MAAIATMAALISPCWNTPTYAPLSQYSLFVAGSGIGKERYTMGVRDVVEKLCPAMITQRKARSDVALMNQLRYSPARMFFFDEFGSWFSATLKSDSSYQKMIATIFLESYMGPRYIDGAENKLDKDCTDHVEYPMINIIGGCTDDALENIMSLDAFRNDGLFGRFEVLMFRGTQAPKPAAELDKSEIQQHEMQALLVACQDACRSADAAAITADGQKKIVYPQRRNFSFGDGAAQQWDEINTRYAHLGQTNKKLLGSLYARLPQRVLRTACTLSAYRDSRQVEHYDLEYALGYHLRNLGSIISLVRESLEDTRLGRIAEVIRDGLEMKKELTRTQIKNLKNITKSSSKKEIDEALAMLNERGLLAWRTEETKGAPKTIYSLKAEEFTFEKKPETEF